ncbi:MAG: hypothetical protein V1806_04580 [Pseudomonadota bacterium]
MGKRYILIRTNGVLKRLLKVEISGGKEEVYISGCSPSHKVNIFRGSNTINIPAGTEFKHDINFTNYEKTMVGSYRGKFHIGYKSTGTSVAVVGPMKSEFEIPGLKELETVVGLEQYYPGKLKYYKTISKANPRDIIIPDMGMAQSGKFGVRRCVGANIEELFGENPFEIEIVAIPKALVGQQFSYNFQKEDPPTMINIILSASRLGLGLMFHQNSASINRGWFDHSVHATCRQFSQKMGNGMQELRLDFRIIEDHLTMQPDT